MNQIILYYNSKFLSHKVFHSSFENEDRIIKTLLKLREYGVQTITEVEFKNDDVSKYLSHFDMHNLEIIMDKYNQKDTWNCEICSFSNSYDNNICEICQSKNVLNLKLIAKVEGDTTCLSKNSIDTLHHNIATICQVIDIQFEDRNDSFILIRPPGHHSNCCTKKVDINPSGFCIINNLAFGIEYIQKKYNLKKIAIIDWDVHHGNGTQEIFYDRDDVLFIDLHRYDGSFYPGTGKEDEIGVNKGINYSINIPLEKGCGEEIYIQKFKEIIIPRLKEFHPEWIFVSCGFDAHKSDPLGGMKLENKSYKKFHKYLKGFFKPITYFLEGGYNTEIIPECIFEMIKE